MNEEIEEPELEPEAPPPTEDYAGPDVKTDVPEEPPAPENDPGIEGDAEAQP